LYCQYNLESNVIRIKLREAMDAYERRCGERLTYGRLAELTGLARATIESIGARTGYNATLEVVDRLCEALGCSPGDILERVDETPHRSPKERALGQ